MVKAAIICEGKSDRVFCEDIIKHLQLDGNAISYYVFGSKSTLLNPDDKRYQDLKLEITSGQIKKALFITDADDIKSDAAYGGFENTNKSLNKLIERLNIHNISNTYIMCDPETKNGSLESLILATIPAPHKNCIEQFLDCSKFADKENHKAVLNKIYNIAYPKTPFDFTHSLFDPLKAEIKELFA